MIASLRAQFEKALFALAALAVLASGGWTWRQQSALRRLRALPVSAALAGPAYEPAGWQQADAGVAAWLRPDAQSSGAGWVYEVFTPPVIHFNANSGSFSVHQPDAVAGHGAPFGLELVAVKREPFRMQLAGYFGGPNDYLAAFTSPRLPATLLARKGRRFADLGLTLKSFEVRKISVGPASGWPVYDVAALAVLWDEQTGADVVLDSRSRRLTDTPLAVMKFLAGAARTRELREGDTFAEQGSTYRIERIQLDPAEVVVARQAPGLPLPEMRVLRPVAAATAQASGTNGRSRNFSPAPVSGLASNEKSPSTP